MMMVVCYDDDDVDDVMVMVGVVVAGCGGDVGVAEVARGASVIVDRVDPEVGSLLVFAGKTRRKSFPAAAAWWPAVAGRSPDIFGRERV
ncbi:hypothetical protein Tco_1076656 [Tanacetum coccineum]